MHRYTWISVPNSLAVSIPFPSSFYLIFTDFLYHSCEIKSLSMLLSKFHAEVLELLLSGRSHDISSIILQTLIICVHKEIDFNRMWCKYNTSNERNLKILKFFPQRYFKWKDVTHTKLVVLFMARIRDSRWITLYFQTRDTRFAPHSPWL